MNLALVGYGKMGHMVHELAAESVVAIIDPVSTSKEVTAREVSVESLGGAACVIDFSTPSSAVDNIRKYVSLGIPAVIGTTGWLDRLCEVESLVKEGRGKIMYSGNFSIGVSIFLSLVKEAARLANLYEEYDVALSEVHHSQKADCPSGTALMAAQRLLDGIDRKTGLQVGNPEGKIDPSLINITSQRVGSVPGIHTLVLDSSADTITVTHSARNRQGFASGAIRAAQWLVGQKPGLYTMDDFTGGLNA